MTYITHFFHLIVKKPHGLRRFNIYRILLADTMSLVTCNKTKQLYLLIEITKSKVMLLIFL